MNNQNVKVIIIRTAGTNCDREAAFAFQSLGASVDCVHINKLFNGEVKLSDYHIMVIPGGFTYGDDIMSGRILANELRLRLGNDIRKFIADQKLILGICNGFQVLVRAGILPGGSLDVSGRTNFEQTVTLTYNDSAKFEDRWVHLKLSGASVWTKGLPEIIYVPIAHAEGKFDVPDQRTLQHLQKNSQIAFRYCNEKGEPSGYPYNPNGSVDHIAGIMDTTGRILGLMPHPERHFLFTQHPYWTRFNTQQLYGQGAKIFENGIKYVRERLLSPEVLLIKG